MAEFRVWAAAREAVRVAERAADAEAEARIRAEEARTPAPGEGPDQRRQREIEVEYSVACRMAMRGRTKTARGEPEGMSVREARAIRRRVTTEVDARLRTATEAAARSLDDGALARRIAELEAELAPFRAEHARRLATARQGLNDAARGLVGEGERPAPGDVIPAGDGGRVAVRSLGGRAWRVSPGQAARFGRPDLAGKTVRYAYGEPVPKGAPT